MISGSRAAALVVAEAVLGVTVVHVVIVEAVVEVVVVVVMLNPLGSPHNVSHIPATRSKSPIQKNQSAQKSCPHRRLDARCKHFDRAAMKC